jgi:hypothetical protein
MYNPQVQFWKMVFLIIIIVEIMNIIAYAIQKCKGVVRWRFDVLSFSILTSMHLLFITALITTNIYQTLPFLLFTALFMFLIHLILHFLPLFLQKEKHIYFFKKISPTIIKTKKQIDTIIESKLK